ncbi:hypothetical protein COSO111634_37445 [Corallococcus soli]
MPRDWHLAGRPHRGRSAAQCPDGASRQARGAGRGEEQHRAPGGRCRCGGAHQDGGGPAPSRGAWERPLQVAESQDRPARVRRRHPDRADAIGATGGHAPAGRGRLFVWLWRDQCPRGAGVIPGSRCGAPAAHGVRAAIHSVEPVAASVLEPQGRERLRGGAVGRAGVALEGSSHRGAGAGACREPSDAAGRCRAAETGRRRRQGGGCRSGRSDHAEAAGGERRGRSGSLHLQGQPVGRGRRA